MAWQLVSDPTLLAGWGRYAVLAEYALSEAGFDGQLLAGREADSDRTAATDLRLGADVDWQRRAALGRAVLTAHIRETLYTLDTDVSALFSAGRSTGDWRSGVRASHRCNTHYSAVTSFSVDLCSVLQFFVFGFKFIFITMCLYDWSRFNYGLVCFVY